MPSPTNSLTLTGNLVAAPELRHTQNGAPVAQFTVAHTPSYLDRTSGEWIDGEALFIRCTVWREYAERVAGSLHKGDSVTVTGRLMGRRYTTKEGEARYVVELEAHDVAATMRFGTVRSIRGAGREHPADAARAAQTEGEAQDAWAQLNTATGEVKTGRRAAA